jgi:hypothetical protein
MYLIDVSGKEAPVATATPATAPIESKLNKTFLRFIIFPFISINKISRQS